MPHVRILDLKSRTAFTADTVECPVRGCATIVPRQRGHFTTASSYRCPAHGIFISPTTWEYDSERDNLLCADADDAARLDAIRRVKRESRMARDNSEDALTWNVFRLRHMEEKTVG